VARGDRNQDQVEIDRETDFDAPVPPEVRQSARLVQIVLAVLALVGLGVVGAFGGFKQAEPTDTVQVNQVFAAGFWDFTVEGAFAGTELHGHQPRDDGNYLIELDVTMLNNYNRSYFIMDSFKLDGMPGLSAEGLMTDELEAGGPKYAYYLRDDRLAFDLEPGLPERIAFMWEIKAGTPVPKELRVVAFNDVPKVASFQVVNSIIVHHDPAATLVVPVTNRTGS
jgi:hypothetical protein